jgi:hypothetical protein
MQVVAETAGSTILGTAAVHRMPTEQRLDNTVAQVGAIQRRRVRTERARTRVSAATGKGRRSTIEAAQADNSGEPPTTALAGDEVVEVEVEWATRARIAVAATAWEIGVHPAMAVHEVQVHSEAARAP